VSGQAFYKDVTGVARPLEEITVAEMTTLRDRDMITQGHVTRGLPIFWCDGDLLWPLPEEGP
jgi:hypothetical protein